MKVDNPPHWYGLTKAEGLPEETLATQMTLADAAKASDWEKVESILEEHEWLVNSWRPGGTSLFTPLHQAAFVGATSTIVRRLIKRGAFRTLQNALMGLHSS